MMEMFFCESEEIWGSLECYGGDVVMMKKGTEGR
jgi:hypothetical protein